MEGGYYEAPKRNMVVFHQKRIMEYSPLLISLIYFCFHVIFLRGGSRGRVQGVRIHKRKSRTISSDAGTVHPGTIVLIIESIFLIGRKRDVRKTFRKIWRFILEVIYG